MAREDRSRLPTTGGEALGQNPFAALSASGLPSAPPPGPSAQLQRPLAASAEPARKHRGRVEIRRTTAGRGGKTVTLISGFVGIGLPEKEQLTKKMRNACGCGGTVKDGNIEIQGDNRERIVAILEEAGFRAVLAGG